MSVEDTVPNPALANRQFPPVGDMSERGGNILAQPTVPLELVPGLLVNDDLQGPDDYSSLYVMDMRAEKLQEASGEVSEWLKQNGTVLEQNISQARDPSLPDRTVPPIDVSTLEKFKPRDRQPRDEASIKFTTDKLIKSLRPDESGETFIKQLLPDGITIAAAMVLIDKDARYRDKIAAACYRVLEQQAENGLLDQYERVKSNNHEKSVHHGDPAIKKGMSRDVVIGMVLDMLSGRFNADENMKTSKTYGDGDRDDRGVFRGGHHSGAAYGVVHALTDARSANQYFGEPYYTKQEKFQNALQSVDVQAELQDVTLKTGTWEEMSLDQGVQMNTKRGDVKVLAPELTNLMISAGEYGNRPISLQHFSYEGPDGKTYDAIKVRRLREAGGVEFTARKQAEALGISTQSQEYKDTVSRLVAEQGYEFVLPATGEITIGRGKNNTIRLEGDNTVSSDHCKVSVVNGCFKIEDTSTNGTKFKYSGVGYDKNTVASSSNYLGPTVRRPQFGEPADPSWDAFTQAVEGERTEKTRLEKLSPTRRRIESTRRNFAQSAKSVRNAVKRRTDR